MTCLASFFLFYVAHIVLVDLAFNSVFMECRMFCLASSLFDVGPIV